jgi:hypothetical protein
MKHIPLSLALAASAIAGDLNIVQLGSPDAVGLEIACGGVKQNVDLPHGGSTGLFALPEKPAVLIPTSDDKIPSLKIAATAETQIAVLSSDEKGYRWTLIPGKPTEEKWTLRAVNLAAEPAKLAGKDGSLEIKPEATQDLPENSMSVRFEGGEKFSYDGSEPCAVVALIYRKDGEWQVLFVPDR